MYKTIICAIGLTRANKTVLARAVELANTTGARLLVLNVLPYRILPKDYQKELKERTLPKIDKVTAAFDISKKNRIIKVGKPYEVICHEAEKRGADLIVIGTHSKKGLSPLLGSVATSVVNHAKCDVSLVRI